MTLLSIATFLLPGLAVMALIGAIAVPLAIHLLFRQRERIVRWAAMRFLPSLPPRRNRRIEHWPLFLARLGVLLLALLAMFAVLPGAERLWQSVTPGALQAAGHGPRTHTVLLIDATLSMRSGETFERAKAQAVAAIRAGRPGDATSVIVLDGAAPIRIAGPSHNADAAVQEVEALTPFDGPGNTLAALTAASDILMRSPPAYARRRLMIFTDRQRSAWGPLLGERPAEVWPKLTARAEVAVIDCGSENRENLAVTAFALSDPLPLIDDPLLVTVSVKNPTNVERRQVKLELSLARAGSTLTAVAQRTIASIPAETTVTESFRLEDPLRLRVVGPHALAVRLLEPDALPADDARYLAFEVREAVMVLLVNGNPSGTPLKRASEFVAEALAPGGRASPGNPFRVRTISYEDFNDASLSDLSAVDAVVLCDVPRITPSQVSRLDALLQRGGGVLIGLGPRAVRGRELYNRLLGPEGAGFLPGTLGEATGAGGPLQLTATDASFRLPPLALFQEANARAGLTAVPFTRAAEINVSASTTARTILSFTGTGLEKPVPALVETTKHRGRVLTFASTLNREWTDWPILPSFLPFVHETVRYAAANADPWTYSTGEAIVDHLPASSVGQTATLNDTRVTVASAEAGGAARFPAIPRAGLYDLAVADASHTIAVNIPESAAGLAESDLRRLDTTAFTTASIQVVKDVHDMSSAESDATRTFLPRAHGPQVARIITLLVLLALAVELLVAWRLDRQRGGASDAVSKRPLDRLLGWIALLLIIASAGVMSVLLPALFTGDLPSFVPSSARQTLEQWLEVPHAGPGEGTRWRIESQTAFVRDGTIDRYFVLGTFGLLTLAALLMYHRERRLLGAWLWRPFLLRLSAYLLLAFLMLPQLRVVFEREGLPEIALAIDTSGSMETTDSSTAGTRLARVKARILDQELLPALLEKQQRIRVYALANEGRLIATVETADDLEAATKAIRELVPNGDASRLGDGVQGILQQHHGGSLTAVIVASDGITTAGRSLGDAGRDAQRRGVPLFTLGVGDRRDALDLAIADLKMDDVVARNDELIVDARLLVRGQATSPVMVQLVEVRDDTRRVVDSVKVTSEAGGKPAAVKLKHRPSENGEVTYVIETPPLPGEADTANNRVERTVLVSEGKKLRVLLIDGRPRYEFRFLKSLLEREVEAAGERSFDFHFLLLDAGKDFATTDRSALRGFPSRTELFEYDVVIVGDIDPAMLPHPSDLTDLADFVRVRGGGLLAVAGEQNFAKLFDTPLAAVLPITRMGEVVASSEDNPLVAAYRPQLTPLGRQHPIFRLVSDDAENAAIWQRLTPMYYHASGYGARQTAEVLATHPQVMSVSDPNLNHPLVLQQFAGAGRVLFLGFDETWRWRLRRDEDLFNRFWRQAVRVLARSRVGRVELRTAKPGPFRRDEPVAITARFPDDAATPTDIVRVSVERTGVPGDRETTALAFRRDDARRATFEATLPSPREGSYRLKLTSPALASTTLEFTVLPPPGERERLTIDSLELGRAASASGGKYYPVDDSASLMDELPEGLRLPLDVPCPPLPLWNLPVVFVTLLSLLGLEWLLRKRARLS